MKNLLIVLILMLGVSIFYSCSKTECETCVYTFVWEDASMIGVDVPPQLLPADTEYCDDYLSNHKEGWVDVVVESAECETCAYSFAWVDAPDGWIADDAATTAMNTVSDAMNSSASGELCGHALTDAEDAFAATANSGEATMNDNGTPYDDTDDTMIMPAWAITMDCTAVE